MTLWPGAALAAALALCPAGLLAAEVSCVRPAPHALVAYVGGVDEGDLARLRQAIAECLRPASGAAAVQLVVRSPGGNMVEGIEIGEALAAMGRSRQVRVRVADYCISACTFIFLGAGWREVPPGATFEPHGFSSWSGERLALIERWSSEGPNRQRLRAAIRILGVHLEQEGRLPAGYVGILEALGSDLGQAQAAFAALPPPYRELLDRWDGMLRVWMVEVERQTALHLLLRQAGVGSADLPPDFDPARFPLSPELLDRVLDATLTARRSGRVPARSSPAAAVIQDVLEQARGRAVTGASSLWRLFEARQAEVDVRALVGYMFSTSILYTRALTREELCDSNVVNTGC